MSDPTIEEFFQGREASRQLLDTICREVYRLGDVTVRVSKSQVAFRRKKNFAVVWMPAQYLANRPTAPLVLTLSFPQRDRSPRWKEITQVAPKRFTHHLELFQEGDIDNQVRRWLQIAWEEAT